LYGHGNIQTSSIPLKAGCGLAGFINFADNIPKPGGSLGYNVKKNHCENWDGDHHVNDAQYNKDNQGFCFDAHIIEFPLGSVYS
jgi:hypothetical protein